MSQFYLFFLLVIYAVFFLLSYILSQCDLASPSVIFNASFIAMLLVALCFDWYFDFNIKSETFWIMAVGAVFFFLGANFSHLFKKPLRLRNPELCKVSVGVLPQDRHEIRISVQIQILVIIFIAFTAVLSVFVIFRTTGAGDWSTRMKQYRSIHGTESFSQSDDYIFVFIREQCTKISEALANVFGFALVYNKVHFGVPLFKHRGYLLIDLMYIALPLLQSGREGSAEFIFFLFLMYFFMMKRVGKKISISKTAAKVLLMFFVFAYAFTFFASRVGRGNIAMAPLVYFAVYVCGGLELFNSAVVGKPCVTEAFGQSSFVVIYSYLQKLNLVPSSMSLGAHSYGNFGNNTVTIYGRWYEDFGVIGVLVMTIIVAMFYAWLYGKAKKKSAPNLTHIIYCRTLVILVLASYDDHIGFQLLTTNYALRMIVTAIIYRLLIGGGRYRYRFAGRRLRWAGQER